MMLLAALLWLLCSSWFLPALLGPNWFHYLQPVGPATTNPAWMPLLEVAGYCALYGALAGLVALAARYGELTDSGARWHHMLRVLSHPHRRQVDPGARLLAATAMIAATAVLVLYISAGGRDARFIAWWGILGFAVAHTMYPFTAAEAVRVLVWGDPLPPWPAADWQPAGRQTAPPPPGTTDPEPPSPGRPPHQQAETDGPDHPAEEAAAPEEEEIVPPRFNPAGAPFGQP